MAQCKRCGSFAINPGSHGRDKDSDLDLCDVCYWRKRAEDAVELLHECYPYVEQGTPEPCGACGTPNAMCDTDCMAAAHGSELLARIRKARGVGAKKPVEQAVKKPVEPAAEQFPCDLPDRFKAERLGPGYGKDAWTIQLIGCGWVTVDFASKCYDLGVVHAAGSSTRQTVTERGRGWKQRLVDEAVEALRKCNKD